MRRAKSYRRGGYFFSQSNSVPSLPNSTSFRDVVADSDDDDNSSIDNFDIEDDDDLDGERNDRGDRVEELQDQEQNGNGADANLDYNNETGPLEPWGNKCKAKLAIILELKNESSPIHDFIPDGKYS